MYYNDSNHTDSNTLQTGVFSYFDMMVLKKEHIFALMHLHDYQVVSQYFHF